MMNWTTDLPTAPGWYLEKRACFKGNQCVRLMYILPRCKRWAYDDSDYSYAFRLSSLLKKNKESGGTMFAGPIEMPVDTGVTVEAEVA